MLNAKVHTCIEQEHVAQGLKPPPAPKCRCRKQIPTTEAVERVKNGEAKWIVVERVQISGEQACRLCKGDPEVKNCANCKGTGKEKGSKYTEKYGNDIVLVSRASVDPKDKKYPSALRAKTPRVATIEANHIHRAYVSNEARQLVFKAAATADVLDFNGYYGNDERGCQDTRDEKLGNDYGNGNVFGGAVSPKQAKAARDRIEEYGRLIKYDLQDYGAELSRKTKTGRQILLDGISAPPDPEAAPRPTPTKRGGCIHSSCLTPDTCSYCKGLMPNIVVAQSECDPENPFNLPYGKRLEVGFNFLNGSER